MWTVAAVHKKATGPLDSYDSLSDKHLAEYFRKCNVRRRLARVGVVESLKSKQTGFVSNYCYCGKKGTALPSNKCNNQRSGGPGTFSRSPNATVGKQNTIVNCQCQTTSTSKRHRSISPYLLPVVPSKNQASPVLRNGEHLPKLPSRSNPTIQCESKMSASRETASEKRSSVPAKTNCEVSLIFHGNRPVLQKSSHLQQQHIKVLQQHCGGSSRVVFNGNVTRGATFQFASQRHCGYAFSVVIFVDQLKDIQLSSCCEYRYAKGSRLGGSQGHFSLANVSGGNPCYKCQLEGRMGSLSQTPDLVPKGALEAMGRDLAQRKSSKMQEKEAVKPVVADAIEQSTSRNDEDRFVSEKTVKHEQSSSSNEDQGDDEEDYDNYGSEDNGSQHESGSDVECETGDESNQPGTKHEDVVNDDPKLSSLDHAVPLTNQSGARMSKAEAYDSETIQASEQPSNGTAEENEGSWSPSASDDSLKYADTAELPLNTQKLKIEEAVEGKNVGKCAQEHATAVHDSEVQESPIQSTAYFVQDKKNQWGSETGRGESFSSDEDVHEAVVTVVTADVHASP
ncbi:glutamate-rich protein 3-like [Ornithodoros turicata]|uniref:glutamate-rich protein 3-like n=1 Tax=Ornithodoros turicata TaxID=34597 RepID=UPI00313952C0